jgi:ACS family tartrate transporter-like MFS transporter
VFILEGIPAVVLGFVTLFYLTDRPRDAGWLEPGERDWIERALEEEKQRKASVAHITVWEAFHQRNVLLLAGVLFFASVTSYFFMFWLPTLVKEASGLSPTLAAVCSGLPYAAALVGAAVAGHSADRTGERRWHTAVPMVLFGLLITAMAVPGQPFWLKMLWMTLAGGALFAYSTNFWVLPTLTLTASAAAASIGMINCIGNLSGFVGPSIIGRLLKSGYSQAQIAPFLSLCSFTAAVLVIALRIPHKAAPDFADEPGPAKAAQSFSR